MSSTLPKDNITDLREKLDYGDRTQPRFAGLNDALRFCSSRFRSSSGIPGPDLYDWHDRAHQTGLDEITNEFLDVQGKGHQFWPDSPSSPCYNKYSYTADRAYIRDLIKKLFFRLIAQAHRNHRYKERKVEGKPAQTRGGVDNLSAASTDVSRPPTPAMPVPDLSSRGLNTEPLPLHHQTHPDFAAQGVSNIPPPGNSVNPTTHAAYPPQEEATASHTKRARENDPRADHDERTKRSKNLSASPGERAKSRTNRKQTYQSGLFTGRTALDKLAEFDESERSSTPANRRRGKVNSRRKSSTRTQDNSVYDVPVDDDVTSSIDPRLMNPPRVTGLIDLTDADEEFPNLLDRPMTTSDNPSSTVPERPAAVQAMPMPPATEATRNPSGQRPSQFSGVAAAMKPASEKPLQTTALEEPVPAAPIATAAQLPIEEPAQLPADAERSPTIEKPVSSAAEAPRQSSVEHAAQPPTASAQELSTEPAKPQFERNGSSSSALPKPSITFLYRVQPSPTRPPKRWYPEGRFQDKSLGELLRELPFEADIEGLVFTIPGSDIPIMERIMRDDEDGFESMKRYIALGIRKWLQRQRQPGGGENKVPRLMVDILIEPIVGDNMQPLEELEEVELDW